MSASTCYDRLSSGQTVLDSIRSYQRCRWYPKLSCFDLGLKLSVLQQLLDSFVCCEACEACDSLLHQPCGSAPGLKTTAPTERPLQIQEDVESLGDAEVAHVVSGGRLVRGVGMLNRACSHHRLSSLHLPDLAKEDDFAGCGLGSPDKGHQVAACNPLRYPSLPISVRP